MPQVGKVMSAKHADTGWDGSRWSGEHNYSHKREMSNRHSPLTARTSGHPISDEATYTHLPYFALLCLALPCTYLNLHSSPGRAENRTRSIAPEYRQIRRA